MKRAVSFLLVFASILLLLPAAGSGAYAAMPEPSAMGGYENLCLTYTWNPNRADNGRHDKNSLLPYTAYIGSDGSIKDYFFDSYLFLPCVQRGPSGACFHRNSDGSNPTLSVDWTAYVEDTFAAGTNVDALEAAMKQTDAALGGGRKAGVFFTILYPSRTATGFGELGGRSLDFSKFEDRKYAVKWMIDEQVRLFGERGYEKLELLGFYWLEEFLDTSNTDSEENRLLRYASDYLHSLGLKFIWIPYYCARGYSVWDKFGFDIACMQPNLFWGESYADGRVKKSCELSAKYGMGMEVEIDNRAFESTEYYNRYLDYLEGGMDNGAMDSIKMYYQGAKYGTYYYACYSRDAQTRSIYDLTYLYAKRTLTRADITSARAGGGSTGGDIEWVSVGRSYTATKAYTNSSAGYASVSGRELTDGVFATSDLGTEWHAFHVSNAQPDGTFFACIDLGRRYDALTNVTAQFYTGGKYGIGLPQDIKLYASDNGTDFNLVGTLSLPKKGVFVGQAAYGGAPFAARYVRLEFKNAQGFNFVFCSEILVGRSASAQAEYIAKNLGDVNLDGAIDSIDYLFCKRIVLGTYTPGYINRLLCDADGSGDVDSVDYLLIKRHALGTYRIR